MSFKDDLRNLVATDIFDKVWDSFFQPKQVGFFINLLKATKQDALNELLNLGVDFRYSGFGDFYICDFKFKELITTSAVFNEGRIYLQNLSSYLSPLALNPKAGDFVLDMCSSPGGKSIVLANLMSGSGNLAAMEANKERFFKLKANLKNYGCQWVKTYNKDARSVAHTCINKFDKILLDAPCSSYSLYNENFKEKSFKEIKSIARLQKQLLNAALSALKVGGEIVYSTCTFYEEENEDVIKNALASKFDIKLEAIDFDLKSCVKNEFGVRILPDDLMNAFFISKIKKLG
ncbi:RsmB/NOP family class I SAM-dependent RNA methyltransferase [Campylobacter hyointestinalis]|uniref:RsmB/NOP family class I SAM-dependent RNA methyltransferase n=1 Tax=Campylobacter hyointestinalis subsp. lawsonii TaxID=91353 RepID=A0AAV6EJ30_CAMHY|nr:RsmB/NOP family class I SAM-dependent RNA methyltransferase [Campylobacter hyointestinalis]KAB0614049.1 RsmB/NOP family class I SAM-dependent RNA methyltransferase [Campylobacter hyointestinalis subsp. lawsonii]QKF69783.1 16S rRNA m5C methyltransferase, RsmB/RsmF family [Campylobacter hyointestinalis subsp. lawsonii]RAZ28168.1 RsmB/NOP family class I SAM-dependent RNA methyltransferase [Campylobacter hyointestinalis subsp. lawsonii]